MSFKAAFENSTAVGLIEDIRSFLALTDGDGTDDAAEVATGTGTTSTAPRTKRKTKAEKEAEAQAAAAQVAQAATGAAQPTFTPPAVQGDPNAQPQTGTVTGFGQAAATPGNAFAAQASGFPAPGAAQQPAPVQQQAALHPIAVQILSVTDKSLASGQPVDNIVAFFRGVIGPDAANATLDQIKQVFIPRLPEATLRSIAPQLGINPAA